MQTPWSISQTTVMLSQASQLPQLIVAIKTTLLQADHILRLQALLAGHHGVFHLLAFGQ